MPMTLKEPSHPFTHCSPVPSARALHSPDADVPAAPLFRQPLTSASVPMDSNAKGAHAAGTKGEPSQPDVPGPGGAETQAVSLPVL